MKDERFQDQNTARLVAKPKAKVKAEVIITGTTSTQQEKNVTDNRPHLHLPKERKK